MDVENKVSDKLCIKFDGNLLSRYIGFQQARRSGYVTSKYRVLLTLFLDIRNYTSKEGTTYSVASAC